VGERDEVGPSNLPPNYDDWTDYTRHAAGIEDYGPDSPQGQGNRIVPEVFDRKRALGVDFGPQFTGLALSLGGVNCMPLGTLQTGLDWQETAVKIAKIASTRRAKEIVVGFPLETDGSEGEISRLVRHFVQLLADTTLLMLGSDASVYLWDERYSTSYAAVRLVTRPSFDGAVFKTWLDGQRGLSTGTKGLLDAESARAILEHWLDKDPDTEKLNKERSERVTPSREACTAYLKWKKKPLLRAARPKEPAGPGKEAWEFDAAFPDADELSPEEYMQRSRDYDYYMQATDHFGDRAYHKEATLKKRAEWHQRAEGKKPKKEGALTTAFREALKQGGANVHADGKTLRERMNDSVRDQMAAKQQ